MRSFPYPRSKNMSTSVNTLNPLFPFSIALFEIADTDGLDFRYLVFD